MRLSLEDLMTVPSVEERKECRIRFTIFPILLIISCLALLITFIVYSVLPDFRLITNFTSGCPLEE
jgi:hypothetical protein